MNGNYPRIPRTNGLIFFTDLDGTLLDHETYYWSAAAPALEAIRAREHCLVLASSKTAAEIAPLRDAVGFSHCPAIVENGAGILPPGTAAIEGDDYHRIRTALDELPADLRAGFSGFGDWSAQEISKRTGLPPEDAERAGDRQFSEPGIWSGSGEARDLFITELKRHGITAQQGGRYLTLSFGSTKADRVREILGEIRLHEEAAIAIALGDAPNDIEMLETADRGFIIANPSHGGIGELEGEARGRIRRSSKTGPEGWNECVLSVINGTRK